MRRAALVLVLTGAVAVAALVGWVVADRHLTRAQNGPTIRIGSGTAPVGDLLTVDLDGLGFAEPGLGAWTIDITYDPSVVSAVGCNPAQGGVCNPNFDPDTVRVTGATSQGIIGDFTLAMITFECVSQDSSNLSVSIEVLVDATVGDPQDINASTENGTITCTEAPTPTPTATPVLVSTGADSTGGNINGFFGSLNLPAGETVTGNVNFSSPLQTSNYVVLLTRVGSSCLPLHVTTKTTAGFSFLTCGEGSVDWAVLLGLTQPTGAGQQAAPTPRGGRP